MITLPPSTRGETTTRRQVSYEEYLQLAPETRIAEWVNGEIITYMPPTLRHQELTWFLFHLLSGFVRLLDLGVVGTAPFGVRLWPGGPAREPDVFYVSKDKLPQLTNKQFEGGPDLVIEIVSLGSVREDKVDKLIEYERAGVGEYWLLDPRPRQKTAEFLRLDESGTYQPVEVGEDGRYESAALPGFWVNVDWLWQDPLPNYQRLVAQMMAENEMLSPELRQLYRNLADSLT